MAAVPTGRAAAPRTVSQAFVVGVSVLALFIAWPASALAQGPPINTQNAFVTGLSGAAFRTFFLAFDRRGLRLDGDSVDDPLDREVRVRGQVFVLPYELVSNRLVVMAVAPYLDKTLEMGPPGNRRQLSVDGFGDLAVAAKLGIYQRDRPNRTTRAALFGRLKLPTGDDDATGPGGQPLPRSLQLGTGSVDYSGGIILTHS
ncbi:MAG: transporter, partial [Acidobacteriota bacterium]